MKKKYLLMGLGIALLSVSPCHAQVEEMKPYISYKLSYGKLYTKDNKQTYATPGDIAYGTDEDDSVFGDKVAIGFETLLVKGKARTEFEIGFRNKAKIGSAAKDHPKEISNVQFEIVTYMLNAYYDFTTVKKFTPYVGFGFGIANIDTKINYDSALVQGQWIKGNTEVNNFAYNFGTGVNYALNDALSIDFGYRYTNLGNMEGHALYNEFVSSNNFKKSYVISHSKISSQEILLGARYNF
jgi:opacity protein-like surface antigen